MGAIHARAQTHGMRILLWLPLHGVVISRQRACNNLSYVQLSTQLQAARHVR